MRVSTKLCQGQGTLLQPYGNALTPSSERVDVNQRHRHHTALAGLDLPSQWISCMLGIRKSVEREKREIISWCKADQIH